MSAQPERLIQRTASLILKSVSAAVPVPKPVHPLQSSSGILRSACGKLLRINQQINKEFYSAYLYLNFSNYFEEVGLDGFANRYKIQAQKERDLAMLFYQYLQNENQKVTL